MNLEYEIRYEKYLKLSKKIIKCPVCSKVGTKSNISRHLMNCTIDKAHLEFLEKQKEKIKEIYQVEKNYDYIEIACRDYLFCSPTYILNIFRSFDNYKEIVSITRSEKTKEGYKSGRRKNNLISGWKPKNRKESGKRVISEERYNKIIESFYTDISIKELSKITKCKHETIFNYWCELHGEKQTRERNKRIKIELITKLKDKDKEKLKILFYENLTIRELSEMFNVSQGTIIGFLRTIFSTEERYQRGRRVKQSTIGSKNEILCFKLIKEYFDTAIHHDYSIVPKLEIDISIPNHKIAINWNGLGHRKPIYGRKSLKRTIRNDSIKDKILKEKQWKHISIIDDGSFNPEFVKQKVEEIVKLANKQWKGKVELC